MISKPQNDFKHTGHVGIDGASFGDIAFLGTTQNNNHVPRQLLHRYNTASEDIEADTFTITTTPIVRILYKQFCYFVND
ncbi:hypothetical protein DOY81_015536 [Sarcophaga bullata]|nr:hypothetical protein DOY81_015536 [Sarcophaga bullata]